MATIYSLVCENGSSGSYWSGLSTDGKARYGDSGSERVYNGLASCLSARASSADKYTEEVIEIGDAFQDSLTSQQNISMPAASLTITSMVSGQRSMAWHGGNSTSGYELLCDTSYNVGLSFYMLNWTVDGIKICPHADGNIGARLGGGLYRFVNNIVKGQYSGSWHGQTGVQIAGVAGVCANNLIINCDTGATCLGYHGDACYVYNNIASKCSTGWKMDDNFTGIVLGNIGFGNTTNWSNLASSVGGAGYNAGESGDTPWDDGGGTAITTLTSLSFEDYAGDNFKPANSTSPQVGASVKIYNGINFDITDKPRPNYNPNGEENWDIGAFEYDHGNGLAPKTVTLEITNIVAGSELAIYKASDNSVIVAPQTVAGTSYSTSYTYTADTLVNIVLRNASGVTKYQPYKTQGNITANGLSVYVAQVEDIIAQ